MFLTIIKDRDGRDTAINLSLVRTVVRKGRTVTFMFDGQNAGCATIEQKTEEEAESLFQHAIKLTLS